MQILPLAHISIGSIPTNPIVNNPHTSHIWWYILHTSLICLHHSHAFRKGESCIELTPGFQKYARMKWAAAATLAMDFSFDASTKVESEMKNGKLKQNGKQDNERKKKVLRFMSARAKLTTPTTSQHTTAQQQCETKTLKEERKKCQFTFWTSHRFHNIYW